MSRLQPPADEELVQFSVRWPKSHVEWIDAYAAKIGTTRTGVLLHWSKVCREEIERESQEQKHRK